MHVYTCMILGKTVKYMHGLLGGSDISQLTLLAITGCDGVAGVPDIAAHRPGWTADRSRRVELSEDHALHCHLVQVGCGRGGVAVVRNVSIAQL